MRCSKCGAEMIDEAIFCGNCGARMEKPQTEPDVAAAPERYSEQEIADNSQSEAVFCPNCGKRLTPEDVFCDECGYNLAGGNDSGNTGGGTDEKKKFKLPKAAVPAVAAVAAVVVVVGAGSMILPKLFGGGGDVSPKVLYIKDDAMMMIDSSKKKAEPVVLTSSYTKKDEYVRSGFYGNAANYISEDGKYIYYVEDRTEDSYDLYRARMSKPSEGTKIESKVSGHRLLKNGNIMYRKKSSLYLYNGKESIRFGKDVNNYYLDKDQKYVCWSETDKGDNVYYLQDIAQKNDKVRLEKEVDNFYYKEDFSAFYVLQGDDLYIVDREGKKEKIAKDVESVISFDDVGGRFYYQKDNQQEIPYADLMYEDGDDEISDYDRESLEERKYTIYAKELCFYDGKEETVVSDSAINGITYSLSDKGAFLMYSELPNMEELKVSWSDMENDGWEWAIQQAIEAECSYVIATEGASAGTVALEDDMMIYNTAYSSDDGKLYLYVADEDGEDGMIYVTDTKGSNVGKLEEYDDDAEDARLLMANKNGLYYLKDYEEGGGDLYLGDERLLEDVAAITRVGDTGKVVVRYDRDYDDSTYAVNLLDGKKNTLVSEDVNAAEVADNGTAVFLVEYDYRRREGSLMYFDGKEARVLDEDVAGFFTRKGSNYIFSE